jgi:hypothetical protein
MDKIKEGDIYINSNFNTEIVVIKELGNSKWLVKGKMGDFTIRENLIRSSYKKKEKS